MSIVILTWDFSVRYIPPWESGSTYRKLLLKLNSIPKQKAASIHSSLPLLFGLYSVPRLVLGCVVERTGLHREFFVVVNPIAVHINLDDYLMLLAVVDVAGLKTQAVLVSQERIDT